MAEIAEKDFMKLSDVEKKAEVKKLVASQLGVNVEDLQDNQKLEEGVSTDIVVDVEDAFHIEIKDKVSSVEELVNAALTAKGLFG